MIKYFCDECGNELEEGVHKQLTVLGKHFGADIHIRNINSAVQPHICRECILNLLASGKITGGYQRKVKK